MIATDRTQFIGASDVGAIVGLDPFCTALKLYGLKTGLIPPDDLSENEAVEWGTRLEKIVSQKFAEKNNVKLIAYKRRYQHPEHAFISCEVDNIIVGTEELVEIKTANAWAIKKWKDENQIPEHYICQVMMQLGLSKRKVGHFAVLVGGQKYLERKIEFDQEFYNNLVSKAVAFWAMVEARTPPMACSEDAEALLALYPTNTTDEIVQGLEEFNDEIARRQELDFHMGDMKKEKEDIENRLKQVIGENAGVMTKDYVVTWPKRHRAAYSVGACDYRTLNIKKNKEKEDGDV